MKITAFKATAVALAFLSFLASLQPVQAETAEEKKSPTTPKKIVINTRAKHMKSLRAWQKSYPNLIPADVVEKNVRWEITLIDSPESDSPAQDNEARSEETPKP